MDIFDTFFQLFAELKYDKLRQLKNTLKLLCVLVLISSTIYPLLTYIHCYFDIVIMVILGPFIEEYLKTISVKTQCLSYYGFIFIILEQSLYIISLYSNYGLLFSLELRIPATLMHLLTIMVYQYFNKTNKPLIVAFQLSFLIHMIFNMKGIM